MADGLTSSVQVPFVAGSSGSSQKLSPTILDLGSFQLTYNPVRQAVSGLFASASSGSIFASLNAFIAVATAGTHALAPGSAQQQGAAAAQAYTTALQLVLRETPAQAYLKFLLSHTSAPAIAPPAASAAPAAPKVTANTGASVSEGGTAFLSSEALSASAGGAPDSGIVYSILNGPSNGYLALASAPNSPISSFTQQDVTAGLVEYINNGRPQTGDSFTFNVSGGSGPQTKATFNISITPPETAPTLKVAADTGASLLEGGSTVITAAQLDTTDTAFGPGKVDYHVTSQPANGHLELSSNPGVAITNFTQKNVNDGQLVYVHNGTDATPDSFTFSVAAGTQKLSNSTFNISVTPVSPNVTTDTGATVNQGSTVTLTNASLNTTDASEPPSNISYTVTSSPANGYLQLAGNPGVSITSFTQADVNAGNVQYVRDGSATTSDAFAFDVSGNNGAASASGTFNINVSPVPPGITTDTGATVNQGATVTLTNANLLATDGSEPPTDISYTVTSSPANGYLQFADNTGVAITSFTQADLNAGNVQYVHDGSATASDAFTFDVSGNNGAAPTSGTFNIGVTPLPPEINTDAGATVNQGSSVTITSANLSATDVNEPPSQVSYTVTSSPANGYLQLAGNPGVAITSFTQADINAGNLQYVHNGTATTADAFAFTVSGGNGASSTPGTFNIAVTPVSPDITADTGATVNQGSSVTLTNANLSATDASEPASSITYSVTSSTTNGYLQLAGNPGVAITSFTQADINAGNVQYVHNGSATTSDAFSFTVSGGNGAAPTSGSFGISVTLVPPDVTSNTGAAVTEGGAVTLTTGNLNASGIGSTPSNLVYNVASSPSYGTLQLSTNPGTAITSFTEADLQAGRVQYVNGGAKASADSFTFNVSDASGSSAYQSFNISVALTPPVLNTNTAATVTEGSTVTLTTSNLHASDQGGVPDAGITYNLTSPLSSGYLQLSSSPGAQIDSFTQAQLSAGLVQYVNSGTSEATTDAFNFTLSDGYATSSTSTFNINVTPAPPVVTTDTGTTVSRLAGSTIITTAQLSATDPGDAASQITFNVTGGLTRGYLDLTTAPGTPITSFTEAQLQAGIVQYVHTALGLAADSFTFTAGDAGATSSQNTFNINVTV
jgi:hypothetical protein